SEEKHEPVGDIDTAAVDSLKTLDPNGRLEKRPNSGRGFMSAPCQKRPSSSAKPSSAGGTGGCLWMDAPDFAVAQAGLRIQSSI
ncbi:MAG: hypothetical protein WAK39_23480, partial [Pseudolabrys sp.]